MRNMYSHEPGSGGGVDMAGEPAATASCRFARGREFDFRRTIVVMVDCVAKCVPKTGGIACLGTLRMEAFPRGDFILA